MVWAQLDGSRSGDEANLSTQHAPPEAKARLSRAHEDTRGAGDPQETPRQGARAPLRVKSGAVQRQAMSATSLTHARDFARVQASGRRARSDGITVALVASEDARPTRVGLAVGRSAGGAVVRNRIKRRLRAAWREVGPGSGYEVVLRAGAAAATVDYQDLVKHVERAVTRATSETAP
jgi:ribonuclease P protein component